MRASQVGAAERTVGRIAVISARSDRVVGGKQGLLFDRAGSPWGVLWITYWI